jgi:hypothetical protein
MLGLAFEGHEVLPGVSLQKASRQVLLHSGFTGLSRIVTRVQNNFEMSFLVA